MSSICFVFFIHFDTTEIKDVNKADQLSGVCRYMKIENETGKSVDFEYLWSFLLTFRKVKDQSAQGVAEIINLLEEKDSDVRKCCGQRYDGAAAMTGVYHCVEQFIKEKVPYAYFVYCAVHNRDLPVFF